MEISVGTTVLSVHAPLLCCSELDAVSHRLRSSIFFKNRKSLPLVLLYPRRI